MGTQTLLKKYRVVSATEQRWSMFAPDPERSPKLVTVKAITAWKEGRPVYNPMPLYASYDGKIEDFFKENSLSYNRGSNLARNILRSRTAPQHFGFYWARQASHFHLAPLAVHVVLTEKVNSQALPSESPYKERILFEVRLPTTL